MHTSVFNAYEYSLLNSELCGGTPAVPLPLCRNPAERGRSFHGYSNASKDSTGHWNSLHGCHRQQHKHNHAQHTHRRWMTKAVSSHSATLYKHRREFFHVCSYSYLCGGNINLSNGWSTTVQRSCVKLMKLAPVVMLDDIKEDTPNGGMQRTNDRIPKPGHLTKWNLSHVLTWLHH